MNTHISIAVVAALVFVAGGYYVFMAQNETMPKDAMTEESTDAMMESDTMMDDSVEQHNESMTETKEAMMNDGMKADSGMMEKAVGTYEAYDPAKLARAEEGTVVLFFHASWCPTCRAFKSDVLENADGIPADVTILEVNYDTETALKQKYGITYQHTYVEVDAAGTALKTWSGSPTLEAFLREV